VTEEGAIAKRASLVAVGTLVSRLLGALRDAVLAACYSVAATDAFFVAFTIPNALRVILGEGAVAAAFIPVLTEAKEKEGMARTRQLYAALCGAMLLILLAVSVLGVVFAEPITRLYAAGYGKNPGKLELTTTLTRQVFPYIFLMGVAALGMGALHTMKRFFAPAIAPAWLNVSLIAAPFVFTPMAVAWGMDPLTGLSIGVLIGGVLHVVAQLPALRAVGMAVWPRIDFRDPGVRKAMSKLAPLMFGVGVYQVNLILSRLFASYLPEGAQSYLYYGQRLVDIPQGMFALAIASATLPSLAQLRHQGNDAEVHETFRYGMRLSLVVALPSSVALAVLAHPSVVVLFGRGSFGALEAAETARSLAWMAAGVWAVACVRNAVQLYYAYDDTRTPVICSTINLMVFTALSLGLMDSMGHAGIAAASSGAAVAQLLALLLFMRRAPMGKVAFGTLVTAASRLGLASIAMGAVTWAVAGLVEFRVGAGVAVIPQALMLLLAATAGLATFTITAYLLRSPEVTDLARAISRRSRRLRR
jgi:putative peptidoglycan lipid II flippase